MPMIREAIVTTVNAAGKAHVAPFGLIAAGKQWVIAPFRPSTTLENLLAVPYAVANFTDDVRLFAGCLTDGAIGRSSAPRALRCRGSPPPCRMPSSRSRRSQKTRRGRVLPAARSMRRRTRPSAASTGRRRRDRSLHSGEPAPYAASREGRAGDRLSFDRHREDGGSR